MKYYYRNEGALSLTVCEFSKQNPKIRVFSGACTKCKSYDGRGHDKKGEYIICKNEKS